MSGNPVAHLYFENGLVAYPQGFAALAGRHVGDPAAENGDPNSQLSPRKVHPYCSYRLSCPLFLV